MRKNPSSKRQISVNEFDKKNGTRSEDCSFLLKSTPLKILELLAENEKMSFSDLRTSLMINPNSLAVSLDRHLALGIIGNECLTSKRGEDRSFYRLTEIGKNVMSHLIEVTGLLSPDKKKTRIVAEDIIEHTEKELLLSEDEICKEGFRREKGLLIRGSPHRNQSDCNRFCARDTCG